MNRLNLRLVEESLGSSTLRAVSAYPAGALNLFRQGTVPVAGLFKRSKRQHMALVGTRDYDIGNSRGPHCSQDPFHSNYDKAYQ